MVGPVETAEPHQRIAAVENVSSRAGSRGRRRRRRTYGRAAARWEREKESSSRAAARLDFFDFLYFQLVSLSLLIYYQLSIILYIIR
jgi:hypothetical protein